MILDTLPIIEGYPFVARRWRRVPMCDPAAVRACCERAAELAGAAAEDEPAAVFFAFADRRAFPFAWKLMASLLARRQAELNGFAIEATAPELQMLCLDVLQHRVGWDAVRSWFRSRLRSRGKPPSRA